MKRKVDFLMSLKQFIGRWLPVLSFVVMILELVKKTVDEIERKDGSNFKEI